MFIKKISFLKKENLFLKFLLGLSVFLLPCFILPFTQNPIEINKIYLFVFLVNFSLLIYLLKISFSKEVEIKNNFIFLFVFLLFFLALLSTFLSADRYFSLFGSFGNYNNGFFVFLFLIIFSFLIFQIFDSPQLLAKLFLLGTFLSVAVFLISGLLPDQISQKLPPFLDFLKVKFFNLSSVFPRVFGMFLSTITVFLTIYFFNASKREKILILCLLFFIYLTLFLLNHKWVWLNLIVSFLCFLIVSIYFKVFIKELNSFVLPILLLFLSFFFLLFGGLGRIDQFELTQKESLYIAFQTLKSSMKNFFIGSGPASFVIDFSKFKPERLNQQVFWSLKFDQAKNYFLNVLIEQGFLSFFSLVLVVSTPIFYFLRNKDKKEIYPYFFAYLSSVFSLFFYFFSFISLLVFWFFLSLFFLSHSSLYSRKKISLELPETKIFLFFILALSFSLFLFLIIFGRNNYLAELNYQKYLTTQDLKERVALLEKTVNLNPYNPVYHLTLGQEYVNLLFSEIKKNADQDRIISLMSAALAEGKRAVDISPNMSFTWEGMGLIAKNLQLFLDGARQESKKNFQKALELDPKSPFLYAELGKIALAEQNLDEAKKFLEKGKALNVFYWDLSLLEARIMEREGKTKEALSLVSSLNNQFPLNVDILFELGRLYFNNNETDLAIEKWKNLLQIFPEHIDALYSLATAYQKKGDNNSAISYLEKILNINPNLPKVKEELENLKKK